MLLPQICIKDIRRVHPYSGTVSLVIGAPSGNPKIRDQDHNPPPHTHTALLSAFKAKTSTVKLKALATKQSLLFCHFVRVRFHCLLLGRQDYWSTGKIGRPHLCLVEFLSEPPPPNQTNRMPYISVCTSLNFCLKEMCPFSVIVETTNDDKSYVLWNFSPKNNSKSNKQNAIHFCL